MLSAFMPSQQHASAADKADTASWTGLKEESLMNAVAAQCHPTGYITQTLGTDGLWELYKLTDGDNAGGGYTDRFASDLRPYANETYNAPPDCILAPILYDMWWDGTTPNRQYIAKDLYNLYPSSTEMLAHREWYPPGIVDTPSFDNGIWRVGGGTFEGRPTVFWQPPEGFEGDVARICFYMLTLYGDGIIPMLGKAGFYIGYAQYPFLAEAAARQLMAWHRSDPVDERERQRNAIFSLRQGNVNPFVEYPVLAELLWGARRGEPASESDFTNQDPTLPTTDSTPLRSVYKLSDRRINLSSPHIPQNSSWEIDGNAVATDHLTPADLGIGIHELRFTNADITGKILIEITE